MKALTPSPPKASAGARRAGTLSFEARDVTGSRVLHARGVSRAALASSVGTALAARLALPRNVPWMLRDDHSGAVLDADKPIGDQIESGAKVVLSPKAHLG
jgi:hypothetical protein